ncbi:MAG: hypothetical protein RSA93_03475, partial [Longicatena sp.]
MKKLLALIVSISMVCISIPNVSAVYAAENEDSHTIESMQNSKKIDNTKNEIKNESTKAIQDDVLSNFNEKSVSVENYYKHSIEMNMDENPAYSQYKNYDVLYQQNTGINTLSSLYFNIKINEKLVTNVNVGKVKEIEGGYQLIVTLVNNPATDKAFFKDSKDFTIQAKFVLTNKNSGESVTVNKNLKAKVVKVVGKIINRKVEYEVQKCFEMQGYEDIMEYLLVVHKSLNVQLLDGSIIDVIGLLPGGAGGHGGPNGHFIYGTGGVYDLKYLLEGATDVSMSTSVSGYLIDKDYNIVNSQGEIVVAFKDRELKSFTSNVNEIKLNAKIGTIPDSSVLESQKRTDLNLDVQYVAYDMSIVCNGQSIQPIGNIDLAIKIPDHLLNKNIGVFIKDEKGKLNELNSTIKGNEALFSTNYLSTFVLMEKVVEPTKPT